jgi:hypothetical protein
MPPVATPITVLKARAVRSSHSKRCRREPRRSQSIPLATQPPKRPTSRRTNRPAADALFAHIDVPIYEHRWTPTVRNPFFAFLALADHIVVNGESMSRGDVYMCGGLRRG